MTTNPLKIQSATSPVSLKEMSTAEMDYMAYLVQTEFATLTTGVGTVQINPGVTTGLTLIATVNDIQLDAASGQLGTSFSDTFSQGFERFFAGPGGGGFGSYSGGFYTGFFTGSFASNPYADGSNATVTTYNVYQDLQSETEALDATPQYFIPAQDGARAMNDTEFNNVVIDHMLDNMAAGGIGSYNLNTSTPGGGGTWTVRGSITDTSQAAADVVYNLYQKTADSAPTTIRPLKERLDGNAYDLIEMTDAQIETWVERFQNQIVSSNKNKYALQASAPGTGTWAQVGIDLDETKYATYLGTYTNTNAAYQGRYISASIDTTTYRLWVRTA